MSIVSLLTENSVATVAVAFVVVGIFYATFLKSKAGQKLRKKDFQKYKLLKKETLTHNTRRMRFACDSPDLPTGAHLGIKVPNPPSGIEDVERSYTPVLADKKNGFFDLIIKVYPDGNLTPRLDALKIGDHILARGPKGTIRYPEPGVVQYKLGKKERNVNFKNVNLICGGTGITPIIQMTDQIIKDADSSIKVKIINGNISIDDRLGCDLLDERKAEAAKKGIEMNVYYTLDKAPASWNGGVGYVTPQMMTEQLFPAGEDTVTLLCGPPPMVRGCKRGLESVGFTKDRLFSF